MPTRIVAGRYRLLSELGRGGMGVVWGALDEVLGREVAVKEVRAPAGLDEHGVRQLYARLEQEGRAAARVEHPNVITVYDVAMAEGSPWIVMELVRGLTLSDVLSAEGPLEPRRAAQICGRVLAGLRAAHEKGVLHRDVKPGNVLIGDDGRVVLTDFGIATFEGSSALTRTGELVGSPEFLPPERALGRTPGPESDLWSLGVLLFVSVEGDSPFRRDTALSTMRAVVEEEPPVPRRAKPLVPVLEGLLRKDPARRLSGWEAQRILDEVAAGRTPYSAPTVVGIRAPAAPFTPPSARAHASPAAAARAITARGRRKRPRRAVAAMAAGVLALLLAAGGIAWALTHNGGGGRSVNGTGTVVGGGAATTTGPSTTTGDGGSSDPGWKTAGFPTGGAKSRTVAHTELSYLSDLRSASVGVRIDGDDIAVPRLRYTAALNTGR
ncbi:serine/threonine-protein kinase [Actinacidiphila oryziradicis]|uniref:serine/threonine-protein kinase n=1 Tax=Actinacidiphila oryziradicis TaxID=2571141 RepID=UPI0023F0AD59|nr:serine/threonine-protein kinase [Actinacidiphila oryziradicis]MCW2874847.1 putative serine/threonine protein kinase [Actinacidiphila oryziradicis]